MAVTRFNAIYLSDERTRGMRPNSVFFYISGADAAASEAGALTFAQAIEGVVNGKLGSLQKQVYAISDADKATLPEGFDADGAAGKADTCKVLFKSANGVLENMSWTYHQHSKTNLDVEAVFATALGEGVSLVNRLGEAIGPVIRVSINPMKPE